MLELLESNTPFRHLVTVIDSLLDRLQAHSHQFHDSLKMGANLEQTKTEFLVTLGWALYA
jgi:hypothetical protein